MFSGYCIGTDGTDRVVDEVCFIDCVEDGKVLRACQETDSLDNILEAKIDCLYIFAALFCMGLNGKPKSFSQC